MITVLTFHRVTKSEFLEHEDISHQTLNFIISKIHANCINIKEFSDNNLKKKWVLSFDDGFSTDFNIVLPLMKKYNITGIFFITTDYVGKKNYLNWDQIKQLSKSGMEIGSHSVNHYDMLSLTREERIYELEMSKKIIEENISKKINLFSFPYGRYSKNIVSEVYMSGYEYCFTSKPIRFKINMKTIPRISINGSMSKNKIIKILDRNNFQYYFNLFNYNIREFSKKLLGIKYYWKMREYLNTYSKYYK